MKQSLLSSSQKKFISWKDDTAVLFTDYTNYPLLQKNQGVFDSLKRYKSLSGLVMLM